MQAVALKVTMEHYYYRYQPRAKTAPPKSIPIKSERIYRPKSMGLAYFLWFVTGVIGGHRFYLGRYFTASFLLLSFTSFLIGFAHVGGYYLLFMFFPGPTLIIFLSFWGSCLLLFFDFFWISFEVDRQNVLAINSGS